MAKNHRGFTLLEIVLSLGLLAILTTIIVVSLVSLRGKGDLPTTSQQLLAVLQLARNRTVASAADSKYGVHFETNQYVLFKGDTYSASATDNEVHTLPAAVEIHDIALGGGNDVVFNRIDGTTDNAGTLGIRRVSDPGNSQSLVILGSGLVGVRGTVAPTDSRVTDSRHLHFDLNWSLQNANTLTLTFANPTVVETIDMAAYFNEDQSEFDWEGNVDVNGTPQILRIHTHSLTDTDTLLSIHRDRRYNDTALTIGIDGKTIVSYTATGTPTVGADGGSLTEQ